MGTRTLAQVAPTAGEIALNAYIHGYGGHSLVTPHAALKQLWWTDQRIHAKVTKAFVISKLRGEEREFLKKPPAFGEGLTDDSYLEWILDKAKRLFLIFTEIGIPDQIFGCIDDAWTDDDLPVSLDDVPSMELSSDNDETLNRRFYKTQFVFLLRGLERGAHIGYGPQEHIPMEYANTLPPAVSLQPWDRVHFPGSPDEIFVRRKFPLTDKDTGEDFSRTFLRDVQQAQHLGHRHVASAWASYVSEGSGYVLSDFVGEHTLRTFIDHRTPMQFIRVAPQKRPVLLCEWMHCLADAVSYMHHRGFAHGSIRPSNILIDHDNNIAFAEVGGIDTFRRGKKAGKTEEYDYAAPESQIGREYVGPGLGGPPSSSKILLHKFRQSSTSTGNSSSSESSSASSTGRNSICTAGTSPASSKSPVRNDSVGSFSPPTEGSLRSDSSFFARKLSRLPQAQFRFPAPPSPTAKTTLRTLPPPTVLDPDTLRDLPVVEPEMSDIYSLGCVFLDILTFLVRGKLNDFVKYRTTRTGLGRSRARPDSSFHADPERIDNWMALLEDESERHGERVYRGAPRLFALVRQMLAQNATLRPTACQVRDRLLDILAGECGVEHPCCAGRDWPRIDLLPFETGHASKRGAIDLERCILSIR